MQVFAFHAAIPGLLERAGNHYRLRVRLPRGLELHAKSALLLGLMRA